MKRYLHAFAMCQSMFCAVPCPWRVWDESARPLMTLFLPVIGLEIGAAWAALAWLARAAGLAPPLRALILCACPFVLTGHIHLDGFMDVIDAVRSCRGLEKRREILKDPHVGSFAVIGCVFVILAQYACFASTDGGAGILILIPAVSRCCSALAVTCLPPMPSSQYAGQKKESAVLWTAGVLLAALLAAGFALCGTGGVCLAGCVVGYGLALRLGYRALEGMNGDIAGYALTIGELCAVAVYALI